MEETDAPEVKRANLDVVVRFREKQDVVWKASRQARSKGTRLASILRALLREWIDSDDPRDIPYIGRPSDGNR